MSRVRDPRLRLALAAALVAAALLARSAGAQIALVAACAGLALAARVPVRALCLGLLGLAAFTVLANGVLTPGPRAFSALAPWLPMSREGVVGGLRATSRLAALSLLGAAVARATTADEVTDVAAMLLAPARRVRGLAGLDVTLGLAAATVPILVEEARDLAMVRRLERGAPHGRRASAALCASLAVPLVVGTIHRAETLARALEARGYDPSRRRSRLPAYPVRPLEVAVVTCAIAALGALVALDRGVLLL